VKHKPKVMHNLRGRQIKVPQLFTRNWTTC